MEVTAAMAVTGPAGSKAALPRATVFAPGAKLSSIDLQLLILSLLARQPAHGYELIRTIEEISGGFYVPSPGMIYPALTYLDEIGHAVAEADGNKKLFSITDAGRAALEEGRAAADRIIEGLGRHRAPRWMPCAMSSRAGGRAKIRRRHGHHALEIARQAIKASLFHKPRLFVRRSGAACGYPAARRGRDQSRLKPHSSKDFP